MRYVRMQGRGSRIAKVPGALGLALCAALLLAATGVGAVSAAGKVREEQRVGQAFCDAWASHDPEQIVALFTEDGRYEDVPFALKAAGSAELRTFAQGFFDAVPDLTIACTDTTTKGGHGSVEWTFSGTDVGIFKTGRPFAVRAASVFETRHGKIARIADYYDAATWMRQVGLIP